MWHKPADNVPTDDRNVNVLCNGTAAYRPYTSLGYWNGTGWMVDGRYTAKGEVIAWAEIEPLPDNLKILLL